MKWETETTAGLQHVVGWLKSSSHAEIVLVIRPKDVVCSIANELEPMQAITLIRDELPRLLQYLIDRRAQKLQRKS